MGCCSSRPRRKHVAPAPPPEKYEPTLLGMPEKVRSRIIRYSVQHHGPVFIHAAENSHQPALSRICRELREETLQRFYGSNDFVLLVCGELFDNGSWPQAQPEGFERTWPRLDVRRWPPRTSGT